MSFLLLSSRRQRRLRLPPQWLFRRQLQNNAHSKDIAGVAAAAAVTTSHLSLLSSPYFQNNSKASLSSSTTSSQRQFSTASTAGAATGDDSTVKQVEWVRLDVSPYHRSNLIFGANTEVGKTVVSAGLVRANLLSSQQTQLSTTTHYIKPLQTGGSTIDQTFVQKYCATAEQQQQQPTLDAQTLFQWDLPVSPHTAALLENKPVSDAQVLSALLKRMQEIQHTTNQKNQQQQQQSIGTTTYIETAGGVLSPSSASPLNSLPKHAKSTTKDQQKWGWIPQADLYQPLIGQAPVVLVGDGRLGGISATLSAMESLLVRGYDIAAMVLIEPDSDTDGLVSNVDTLREYATSRAVGVRSGSGAPLFTKGSIEDSIVGLSAIPSDLTIPLHDWYASEPVTQTFDKLNAYLQNEWTGHVSDLQSMRREACKVIWWPFTQHGHIDPNPNQQVTVIDSANGDYWSVLTAVTTTENDKDFTQSDDEDNENDQIDDDDDDKPPNFDELTKTVDHSSSSLQRLYQFDSCASWWTQGMGHGDSSLALSSAAAAGRYGHVLFPQVVHAPALQLCQKLVSEHGPGHVWAQRVFFSDDGSTGMEVAIKMALKAFSVKLGIDDGEHSFDVIAQEGCYHGDTLGVMNVAEPSIFNEGQTSWYEPKGFTLPPPTIGFRNGKLGIDFPDMYMPEKGADHFVFDSIADIMNIDHRRRKCLFKHYVQQIELQWAYYELEAHTTIGACIIEPVLMGAGGMKFVDPLWQRALCEVSHRKQRPVIFDEVASGLWRVGVPSCKDILRWNPDIAVYGKLLTGGLVPMSVTLAREEIFAAYYGDDKGDALLHGHSYTAHPVGCVVALQALEAYESVFGEQQQHKKRSQRRKEFVYDNPFMLFDVEQVKQLSHLPLVDKCFTLGTVLSVTIHPEETADGEEGGGYAASSRTLPMVAKLKEQGIYARPLGNVLYIMASPFTSKDECRRLTSILHNVIQNFEQPEEESSNNQKCA